MLGALFIAISLLGGGIELRELKIPQVGKVSRILSCFMGFGFIGLAIYFSQTPSFPNENTTVEPKMVKEESSEVAEWMTLAEYEQKWAVENKNGYYLDKINGRCDSDSGSELFRAEWKPRPLNTVVRTNIHMDSGTYESHNDNNISEGYYVKSTNIFKACSGDDMYQAIWFKKNN